jgi:hypothetical protein
MVCGLAENRALGEQRCQLLRSTPPVPSCPPRRLQVHEGVQSYGVPGQGWLPAFSGFRRHVKLSFFKGTSLEPVPPIGRDKDVRCLHVRRSAKLDEKLLATWIEQAASIPGRDGGSPR